MSWSAWNRLMAAKRLVQYNHAYTRAHLNTTRQINAQASTQMLINYVFRSLRHTDDSTTTTVTTRAIINSTILRWQLQRRWSLREKFCARASSRSMWCAGGYLFACGCRCEDRVRDGTCTRTRMSRIAPPLDSDPFPSNTSHSTTLLHTGWHAGQSTVRLWHFGWAREFKLQYSLVNSLVLDNVWMIKSRRTIVWMQILRYIVIDRYALMCLRSTFWPRICMSLGLSQAKTELENFLQMRVEVCSQFSSLVAILHPCVSYRCKHWLIIFSLSPYCHIRNTEYCNT